MSGMSPRRVNRQTWAAGTSPVRHVAVRGLRQARRSSPGHGRCPRWRPDPHPSRHRAACCPGLQGPGSSLPAPTVARLTRFPSSRRFLDPGGSLSRSGAQSSAARDFLAGRRRSPGRSGRWPTCPAALAGGHSWLLTLGALGRGGGDAGADGDPRRRAVRQRVSTGPDLAGTRALGQPRTRRPVFRPCGAPRFRIGARHPASGTSGLNVPQPTERALAAAPVPALDGAWPPGTG